MTYNTDIFIRTSSDEEKRIEELNQLINKLEFVGYLNPPFEKVLNTNFYYGFFNHLNENDLIEMMKGLDWKFPFSVVIVVENEYGEWKIKRLEDDATKLINPDKEKISIPLNWIEMEGF